MESKCLLNDRSFEIIPLILVPTSVIVLTTLKIQNDEINCTSRHRTITFSNFIAPFQSNEAEQ